MSVDNLKSTMTDRVLEPRCDNEDLKMISNEGADEFSRITNGERRMTQQIGEDIKVDNQVDSQVGIIELKLTHHGDNNQKESRFKKRLRSAGPNNKRNNVRKGTGGWSSFSVNKPTIV